MSNFWDQLGFLVTKILDDDSHSLFPHIKDKKSVSSISWLPNTNAWEDDHRNVVHMRHYEKHIFLLYLIIMMN
jgi:hypothetical protein